MKAKELYESLFEGVVSVMNPTCDGLIVGDENVEVIRVATCFKLTAELIDKAVEAGANVIITHEPTFACGDKSAEFFGIDKLRYDKLVGTGITLYRYHDHAHHREDDIIHAGFISALGLNVVKKYPIESLGVRRYEFAESLTPRTLAKLVREKLGVDCIRIVGDCDIELKNVCLGLGAVGMPQINRLFDPGSDIFVTGEVGEVIVDEYVRDACYFGKKRAVMVLGHYSSEYAGMRLLADKLNGRGIDSLFLEGGEVYKGV